MTLWISALTGALFQLLLLSRRNETFIKFHQVYERA